jgi:hypothetical protein
MSHPSAPPIALHTAIRAPTGATLAHIGANSSKATAIILGDHRSNNSATGAVYARGYDHNFVLNKPTSGGMTFAARAYDPLMADRLTGHALALREPRHLRYSWEISS